MTQAQQIGEIKRAGGWRGSPNSLAALEKYRTYVTERPRCKHCKRVAIKGRGLCRAHLGGHQAYMSPAQGRGEVRLLMRLERLGLLPFELLSLPVWRRLSDFPTKQRGPMRVALLQAWDKRFTVPNLWAATHGAALRLERVGDVPKGSPWRDSA
jgi:hypothetical protein